MKSSVWLLVASIWLMVFVSPVWGVSEEEILERANPRLYPQVLEKKLDNCPFTKLPLIGSLLRFLCGGVRTQPTHLPEEKTVKEPSAEDLERMAQEAIAAAAVFSTEGEMEVMFRLPLISDLLERLFGGKKSGFAQTYWPQSLVLSEKTGEAGAREAVRNVAGKMLIPAALQEEIPYVPPEEEPPAGTVPTLPPLPTPVPGVTFPPGGAVSSLDGLFQRTGSWAGVPWQIIKAMAIIEGSSYRLGDDLESIKSGVFALSAEEIVRYQQAGEKAPINCRANACSAAGVMQLTATGCVPFDTCEVKQDDTTNVDCDLCSPACQYKPSAWSYYKSAVLEAENDGRVPNVCNLKDTIFAATKKMKVDSGTDFGVAGEWSQATVYRVAERYYGACTPCDQAKPGSGAAFACRRLGKTYCQFVWDYYQGHK